MKKIVFLVQNEVTFNCVKLIYEAIIKENHQALYVAVPSSHDPGSIARITSPTNEHTKKVLEKNNYEYFDLETVELNQRVNWLSKINPDLVILCTKDDQYMLAGFGVTCKDFADKFKTLYIPYYGATCVDDEDLHTRAPGHKFYWKFLVDNEQLKNYYINFGIQENNIINAGHPKLEEIYAIKMKKGTWPIKNTGELKIIWAPHWSCHNFERSPDFHNTLKFGTFFDNCFDFLKYAGENITSKQFVFRPHPLLQWWLRQHYKHHIFLEFLEKWNSLPNTYTQFTGLYNDIFAESDVMVTDGISFLIEYPLATGKNLIFLDSGVHAPFNEIGKIAKNYWLTVKNFNDVENLLKNQDILNINSGRALVIEQLLDKLLPYRNLTSSTISKKIIDFLN